MIQKEFLQNLEAFLEEWNNSSPTLEVHTSGSTGAPKALQVEKKRMIASARQTCRFLGLKEGDTALLCMPLQYIAGKMVVVRSLIAGLELIPIAPCGHPLATLNQAPHFAAMTPMQVYNSLQEEKEKSLLKNINQLIIGGGAIDTTLAHELKNFPHHVWSTYGMTETLSHIALRRLNGSEASDWYTPFEGVRIRLSDEGTLAIHAPEVCPDELITNDLAEINATGQFRILGRKDNTINSGGVKIQIEQLEEQLKTVLNVPFQITSAPDKKFGEVVVLLYEGTDEADIPSICQQTLPSYRVPKHYLSIDKLPTTGTGKPDRASAKRYCQTWVKQE